MVGSALQRFLVTVALGGSLAVAGTLSPAPVRAQSYGPTVTVRISGYMFHPRVLDIPVGTTVMWKNYDSVQHTTTSNASLWNSGPLNPGASFSYTFTVPGTYRYHCMIHPYMHGVVIVRPVAGQIGATSNPVLRGGTTTMFGQGFTPRARIFVRWWRPDGTRTAVRVVTARNGTFAFRLFAAPQHGCGPRIFMAFDSVRRTWSPLFVLQEIC